VLIAPAALLSTDPKSVPMINSETMLVHNGIQRGTTRLPNRMRRDQHQG